MTNPQPRPAIRKAPDTDRHPALAAYPQIDLRDEAAPSETGDGSAVAAAAESPLAPDTASDLGVVSASDASATPELPAAAPKKSRWHWFFSRS